MNHADLFADAVAIVDAAVRSMTGAPAYDVHFRTPDAWNTHETPRIDPAWAVAVIVHDGGDLSHGGGPGIWRAVHAALTAAGYGTEGLTGWATAVYRLRQAGPPPGVCSPPAEAVTTCAETVTACSPLPDQCPPARGWVAWGIPEDAVCLDRWTMRGVR